MSHTTHIEIAGPYKHLESELMATLSEFDHFGEIIQQERNTIRKGKFNNLDITIKSFKTPSWIQGFIYGMFRPGKAKRSFLYASILMDKDIGTAQPIAYVEHYKSKILKESYFISTFIEHDFTIREVLNDKIEDKPRIMQEFVEFTLRLHENQVQHLDHSPGNTLIKKSTNGYSFSIIDINRMKFKDLNLHERLNNFVRLAASSKDQETFARSYAKLINEDPKFCLEQMNAFSNKREKKVQRKKRLKRFFKR